MWSSQAQSKIAQWLEHQAYILEQWQGLGSILSMIIFCFNSTHHSVTLVTVNPKNTRSNTNTESVSEVEILAPPMHVFFSGPSI